MTSRELVIRTLNHQPVPRIPRDLWIRGGDDAFQGDEVAEIRIRYPNDIVTPELPSHGRRSHAKASKTGEHTDAWGCVWAEPEGGPADLKHSPLAEGGKIASYQPPAELLDQARFAKANKLCMSTNRFVLAWSEVRPFDRLRFLRGSQALSDLARGTKDIRALLARLHDFACRELEAWAASEVDGVAIGDDWGTPEELMVSVDLWRDLFRPLYRQYCQILHAKDKFVFFHSEGNILDIFGELVKTGIDAIHCQLQLMGVERLAKRYRGRVTFWGGIDRQQLRHPGSPDEFRDAVLAVRRALDFGCGGIIAQCQWDPGVRLQTMAAFCEQWLVPLPMHV
jgi:uroporphyrinogen decarboxylase